MGRGWTLEESMGQPAYRRMIMYAEETLYRGHYVRAMPRRDLLAVIGDLIEQNKALEQEARRRLEFL